jgi:ketosteroid isomerase-like protein
MSQENVEIVRRLYRAMDARDLEAFTELAHPEVEWIPDTLEAAGLSRAGQYGDEP